MSDEENGCDLDLLIQRPVRLGRSEPASRNMSRRNGPDVTRPGLLFLFFCLFFFSGAFSFCSFFPSIQRRFGRLAKKKEERLQKKARPAFSTKERGVL